MGLADALLTRGFSFARVATPSLEVEFSLTWRYHPPMESWKAALFGILRMVLATSPRMLPGGKPDPKLEEIVNEIRKLVEDIDSWRKQVIDLHGQPGDVIVAFDKRLKAVEEKLGIGKPSLVKLKKPKKHKKKHHSVPPPPPAAPRSSRTTTIKRKKAA